MVSRLTAAALLVVAVAVSGCETVALKCPGWVKSTLPIKPSRQDQLTRGTQDQIVAANESWEAHCR